LILVEERISAGRLGRKEELPGWDLLGGGENKEKGIGQSNRSGNWPKERLDSTRNDPSKKRTPELSKIREGKETGLKKIRHARKKNKSGIAMKTPQKMLWGG